MGWSIGDEKTRLLEEIKTLNPESQEYAIRVQRISELCKSESDEKGWRAQLGCGVVQTAMTVIASTVNVWKVLKHEERGNVVTTKSLNYAPKPQEHSNQYKGSKK